MWLKTRTGLVGLKEPVEILVANNTKTNTWSIYANLKVGPEVTMRNLFGQKAGMRNPSAHLALFLNSSNVNKEIAETMAQIESTIRSKSEFCDLSQSGDAQAWTKAWQQIQWPKNSP